MKTPLHLAFSILLGAALLTGCATSGAKKPTTAIPSADTVAQIQALPRCRATVEEHHACYSAFRTADGQRFFIGGPGAGTAMWQFLRSLKEGQTYEFPAVFLAYQKTLPAYVTAAQIKAMPPRLATVEHLGARDACLATYDGQMFFLGSPAAPPEVVQFLQTLKEGQDYEFPAAFLAWQKQQSR